ncbi:MAG: CRISPR-associated helicase Cas3', partial [Verrucomicrobia bacterium]|nr:CRISPR-associated helicase Cas3' [Verrucomicrobiota bacterium]
PCGTLRQTEFSAAFATGREPVFQPNSLQQAVADAAKVPGIVVVEGPMGCGKTEAALFAAQQLIASGQQQGIYFALPTQVTSNRIHKRIERFLRNTLADDAPLRLAHGNAWLEDDFVLRLRPSFHRREQKDGDDPDETIQQARSWFVSSKQALLAPYGVGTIDQALQGVVAVKHFFVRRFALAGKVVILDEVHSYDIYTGTLISALIRELVNLRCSVIILSATLTAARRRELLAAAGVIEPDAPAAYPLVTTGTSGGYCRHISPESSSHRRINLRPAIIPEVETVTKLITRAEAGQHVLWIRNTVVEAQDAFCAVCGSICEGSVRVGLLHSRFPFQRRAELEDEWLERLGKNRPADEPGSILIATQVVEQSVDIDLDFVVSDLAPTDMLLQRLGRLWRHERSHRHASAPEFWIRLPELSATVDAMELKKALGRSARVYAPYVLLRTMEVWQAKSEFNLPADIRPLLEATYTESAAAEPEAWRELHAELETEKRQLAANAEAATRVLANPMLADKEEVLTRRKGAPTKSVVLLRSISTGANGLTTLVALDGSQTVISEHEWRRASARFLHHWIVRAPRWMVSAAAPRPRWLALHGPAGAVVATVGDDGRCAFGDQLSAMTYDPRLGIFSDHAPQSTPQTWKDDDDDEFDS